MGLMRYRVYGSIPVYPKVLKLLHHKLPPLAVYDHTVKMCGYGLMTKLYPVSYTDQTGNLFSSKLCQAVQAQSLDEAANW